MDWTRHGQILRQLPYGKTLPTAVYLHRDTPACQTGALAEILRLLIHRHSIEPDFNVVKFRTDAPRISFLEYQDFDDDPHPALRKAIAIDLVSGRSYATSYHDNLNPPILHRKELLLAPNDPRIPEFAALSAAEERAGLYANTAIIGFRINWERLLSSRGVIIEGHFLRYIDGHENGDAAATQPTAAASARPVIHRYKTALTRYTLSKPVKSLIEYNQLPPGATFFDYGCGLGDDVCGLRELGYQAFGWDPVHDPLTEKIIADVVNLGYVLNVIEDPAERLEALIQAWGLARRLLVVSALIGGPTQASPELFQDGILTRRQTFQKYFTQQELQHFLEDALEVSAVPPSLGIFYVFRDPADHQLFIQARSRRTVDWSTLVIRPERARGAADGVRQPRAIRPARPDPYEQHCDLLEDFWAAILQLGRLPLATEYARFDDLRSAFGSTHRALRILLSRGRREIFETAQAARKNDLLVYLASANLRKHIPFHNLAQSTREDITAFFGNYKRALEEGLHLLRSAADPNTIVLACDDASLGWQDDRSLYVHVSLLDRLPVVLRSYIICGELLFGSITQADIVKVHKFSGKVTFLAYTGFDSLPLPELRTRTKVNLRTGLVETYDHTGQGQLLYFKERYLDSDHPARSEMAAFGDALRQLGVPEDRFVGPPIHELCSRLRQAGRIDLLDVLSSASGRPTSDLSQSGSPACGQR
jgi:DNA phosphorothioation-associated putative methyltransferase